MYTATNQSAELIEVGILPNDLQFIPQGMIATLNTGYCISDCSEQGFPNDGVPLFASMFHAHTVGVAINLGDVRDGSELTPIDSNWHYDFDYQNLVSLGDGVSLLQVISLIFLGAGVDIGSEYGSGRDDGQGKYFFCFMFYIFAFSLIVALVSVQG